MRTVDALKEDLKKAYEAGVITLDDVTEYIAWLNGLQMLAERAGRLDNS